MSLQSTWVFAQNPTLNPLCTNLLHNPSNVWAFGVGNLCHAPSWKIKSKHRDASTMLFGTPSASRRGLQPAQHFLEGKIQVTSAKGIRNDNKRFEYNNVVVNLLWIFQLNAMFVGESLVSLASLFADVFVWFSCLAGLGGGWLVCWFARKKTANHFKGKSYESWLFGVNTSKVIKPSLIPLLPTCFA